MENYVKNVISYETTCHFGAIVITRHLHNITYSSIIKQPESNHKAELKKKRKPEQSLSVYLQR